jgi:hypothetical protein
MSTAELKNEIFKHLDGMNTSELKQAWLILKELQSSETTPTTVSKQQVEEKITIGIQQLDRGEGKNFHQFLNKMSAKYGSK